jgi:hypothetical protein
MAKEEEIGGNADNINSVQPWLMNLDHRQAGYLGEEICQGILKRTFSTKKSLHSKGNSRVKGQPTEW